MEEVSAVSQAEIDFGLDGQANRENDRPLTGCSRDGAFEAGRPGGGEQLLRIGADIRAEPGVESLMSRRPSELREAPYSRPPVVPVLAV